MEDIIMTEKNLIPLLRFPKFVRDAEWICTTLRAEMDYENGVAHENDIDSLGKYIVVNSKFISTEGQIEKRSNNAHCLAEENDILMVLSDLPNGKAIAKCFYVDASNKYTVNQRICKLRSKGANSKLLYYLLNRNPYFLSFDDGVKQTNLKKDEVLSCPLIIPKSIEEQQKIAECLSSIDSYISSINEKVEQLKAHKKSLMQKLFPQKGQTIPEYRFPEFDNNGKWEKHILSDITSVVNERCGVNNLCIETYISTENMLPNYGGVKIASKLPVAGSFTYFMKVDVLFSNIRPYLKKVWCANFDGVTSNDIIVFRAKTGFDACFVSCILMSDAFIDYSMIGAKGVKMPRGDKDMMLNYNVYVPYLEEQQKIAECLSSIDEAIRLYSEKAFLMEQHKKGLMQQLFPTSK